MSTLHKKIIYNISENNLSEANKLLEQLIEARLRARVQATLQQVDEGILDRLGAKASGLGAGLKAKAKNFATNVISKPKAAVQAAVGAATGGGFDAAANTLKSAQASVAANDPAKKAKAAQANNLLASFAKDLSTLYPDVNAQKVLANLRSQLNFSKA